DELRELKEKPFTKRIALTTAMFAVCLAIVSLGGNNSMKEMLLAQQQSSDQWSFYQAKVVREHLYRNQKMRLELDLAVAGESLSPANRQRMEETPKQFSAENATAPKRRKSNKKPRTSNANATSIEPRTPILIMRKSCSRLRSSWHPSQFSPHPRQYSLFRWSRPFWVS
ncbi:MAG TPA: DUF4337 family protein, partial [Candidatus Methylomirabilis sp.]